MLILLPNLLGECADHTFYLPPAIGGIVHHLDGLIAESEKGGRHFMKRFTPKFRDIPIALLNEHTKEIDPLLPPLQKGETWGLVSDAGLPILADPGAALVRRLHRLRIPVQAYPGPSSIIYALQISGLPAQRFTFHGYPPKEIEVLIEKLRTLPKDHTHIFIEAPYRSQQLLFHLLHFLQGDTDLSISWNIYLPNQGMRTDQVHRWRSDVPELGKSPAVFVICGKKSKPLRG